MSMPNLKRISLFVQKLLGGSKISKLGHVTLSHAPFERETLNWCRNPSTHTDCQILFFSLDPLLSYGWKQCEWAILKPKLAMRMRCVTWPGGRRSSETTYLESATQVAYSLYNFYGLQRRLRGVYMVAPHCKAVFGRKFSLCPVKIGPKNGGFSGIAGRKC